MHPISQILRIFKLERGLIIQMVKQLLQQEEQVFVVMPAKDEGSRIAGVINATKDLGFDNIVVVNDGSSDNTAQVANNLGAHVINHPINLGAGAATQSGIDYALRKGADVIVTIDADQQHYPDDIAHILDRLVEKNADIVIGSRFLNKENKIPFIRIVYNKIGNLLTFIFTGMVVTDSQSGMKAFRADFAKHSRLNCNGYEFCMEIIKYVHKNDARLEEVPIKVSYHADVMQKGQNFLSGVRMVGRMLKSIF